MLNTAAALGVPEHEITEQPMVSAFNNRALGGGVSEVADWERLG